MPFQTPTQFVALALTLLAGWLLGLASTSGGKKWRERLQDAEVDAAAYRHQAEIDLKESSKRIRELEAECDKLKAGAATPVAAAAAADTESGAGWRGWSTI